MRTVTAVLLAGTMLAALGAAPGFAAEKAAAKAPAAYKAPRTVYGTPDFSGNWASPAGRMERAPNMGERMVLTEEEVAKSREMAAKRKAEDDKPVAADAPAATACGLNCPYGNSAWGEENEILRVNGQARTSIITNPSNGRIPPMKPAAVAREKLLATRDAELGPSLHGGPALAPEGGSVDDNPESRTLGERCLTSFGNHSGPVMTGGGYNSNYSIAQTKDEVAIIIEMPHDQRIIRIGGKHPPSNVRYWQGDSIGHWEGDTLVVETTNYRLDQTNFNGSLMANLKVTERFTRVKADRLLYQFEVEDPDTWTAKWGGEYEFNKTKNQLYEYACHEGNYGLEGILSGAREQDRLKAEAAAAKVAANTAPPPAPAAAPTKSKR